HLRRACFLQSLRAHYREACHAAAEGSQLALEAGDAYEFLLGQYFAAWAQLHLGRWGEMVQTLRGCLRMAEENGHRGWLSLFQLQLAWLHEQAFDYERARELGAEGFRNAQEVRYGLGQIKGQTLLGSACLGLGQNEAALACYDAVVRRLDRERIVIDWVLRMPVALGLSECALAVGDPGQALREARRVCELAAQPGERTYLALGRRALAEAALAEGHWAEAEAELARALAALEGGAVPLAEWRGDATGARRHGRRRRRPEPGGGRGPPPAPPNPLGRP